MCPDILQFSSVCIFPKENYNFIIEQGLHFLDSECLILNTTKTVTLTKKL